MIERLAGIVLGTLICAVASAQSLDDRVRELERRVEQLEKQGAKPASPASANQPVSSQTEKWRSLRRGMTESDVRSVLGEPSKVDVGVSYVTWEYPERGNVRFDFNGRVQVWSEPR
jgi:hypothetical protein